MRRVVVAGVVLALAAGSTGPVRAAPVRGFTVEAAAYPVEPAPGTNQTELGVRPAAAYGLVSNPPASSYGRAAAYDLGTIELYTGPPPPESVAECDTGSPNIPDSATAAPADMRLAATCRDTPAVEVTADARSNEGAGYRTSDSASRAAADGSGEAVTAEASVTVHDVALGPLSIGSVSTHAAARADGKPGGAAATGRVTATGSTVNGTPVVIGPDGVEVDRQKVPIELVPTATESVRQALGQGGYSDVRVVQPATEASADGLHVSVRGGGLRLYFTNNDPSENYFLGMTFAGVQLSIDLGPVLGGGGQSGGGAGAAGGGTGGAGGSVPGTGPSGATGSGGPGAPATAAPADDLEPVLATGRRQYDLAGAWQGWLALAAIAVMAAVVGWLTRRRLVGWWDMNADRYLRG